MMIWVDQTYFTEFGYNNFVNKYTKETTFFINYEYPSMEEFFLLP